MKFYLKYLIFAFLAFSVQARAMNDEDYYREIGLEVKPLNTVKVKPEVDQDYLSEFKIFQEYNRNIKYKIVDYKIIKSFILDVLNNNFDIFFGIENVISKPLTGKYYMDREISVPLSELAETISSKCSRLVTQSDLEEHLSLTKNNTKAADRYGILEYFSSSTLKQSLNEVQKQKDFDAILEDISVRVERDIRLEFKAFESEYYEKRSRVLLKEALDHFAREFSSSKFGSYDPTSTLLSVPTTTEMLWERGYEVQKNALPIDYDISIPLMQVRRSFLHSLTSCDDSYDFLRVCGRFVIRRLPSLHQKEVVGLKYQEISLVDFQDGYLRYKSGELVNTSDTIWSLHPHGLLCIYPKEKGEELGLTEAHHSYFFQKDDVGLPLACGGHIEVRQGKIVVINRNSGHHMPFCLQLILAISYFHEKGVLAEDLVTDVRIPKASNISHLQGVLKIESLIEIYG